MNSDVDVLSFMDFLDLDEDLIFNRLSTIMNKEKFSDKHLRNAIQLLQYKLLIVAQDGYDSENEEECDFAAKLIQQVSKENVDYVCKIVSATLRLNIETMVNRSEHLLQQILPEIDLPTEIKDHSDSPEPNSALLNLKISDSILETVISTGEKLTLPLLELPVRNILLGADEPLKIHFLTSTVPKLFSGISGYNILDKIWECIKQLQNEQREITLKVLSSLSEYYLPVADIKGKVLFQTKIVYLYEFWHNILYGLSSTDPSIRKISIYLAKRAIDCVMLLDKNINVKADNHTIFTWDSTKKITEKSIWDNFFILMDSLEEKQSNIVLPSLKLFGFLKILDHWLNCAFNIGLKHDNTQVRLKCIQYRLEAKINSQPEAIVLLEALNDINIYDNPFECDELKERLTVFMSDKAVLINIFVSIPLIKWSPVPLYHITSIISEITIKDFNSDVNAEYMIMLLIEILKVSCNNVAVRKAVVTNIIHFVSTCCEGLPWKDYGNIFCLLQSELKECDENSPLNVLIKKISIKAEEKTDFFHLIEYLHIDFCLLYIQHHPEDMALFMEVLLSKIKKVHEIVTRQYSNKTECLKDVIYLTQLYKKSSETSTETINIMVAKEFKTILHYLVSLLSDNTILSIDEMNLLSDGFSSMSSSVNNLGAKEILLQLYKTCVLFIKDKDASLDSRILSLFLVHVLSTNPILLANYRHEMISLTDIITMTSTFESTSSVGRVRNTFYEKSCEILDLLLNNKDTNLDRYAKDIAEYIENVIECGGYGCLRWCLRMMNNILPCLLQDEDNKFDVVQFITRMWKEIEELKSNNQYNPCIAEFINLITQEVLLKRSMYNNIIILYCKKIVEYGAVKTAPLFYLIRKLNSVEISAEYGQVIYVLCEVLLYSPVPRKDQRILENLVIEILQQPKYGFNKQNADIHFNYQIQYLAILALCKVKDADILENISAFIRSRIDEAFRTKQRYHGHSQAHRLLLTALQHLLLVSALKTGSDDEVSWSMRLLGSLPHQPSVRICLEWFIALHLCLKKSALNGEILECLNDIPLPSQFMILYWSAKHKVIARRCSNDEYEFVMDFLLSHTMGQMFNIRLHAQYLAVVLHSIHKNQADKYSYIIQVIHRTFIESVKDKNYMKLQQDYFVNDFDIVNDLTPSFIYYFLPRYCEISNKESVDLANVKDSMKNIKESILECDFFKRNAIRSDEEVFSLSVAKNMDRKVVNDDEAMGTIQKKYIPWKNMSDVNVYESGKKKEKSGQLVVVASLIDKLPNLGGLARTGEVFGVITYVVDSLRHLQDKQFQGLSVSAERWIDVEEVRPGAPLKEYLTKKKAEGYAVVAAEQTSTSCQLQAFKFPNKTLLLLGHEKEGIPCDLLPMMDHCVEIPQQGFVRSLNVHVTAAIFIWEYTRQNIL